MYGMWDHRNMMNFAKILLPKRTILPLLIFLAAAGCNLPGGSAPGPRAWIDFPLDGSTIELGAVVVYSHASDPVGVTELELYVDGELARVDAAVDDLDDLAAFEQVWTPPGNGSYILQVRAKNSGGSYGGFSNQVHLTIGETVAVPEPLAPITVPAGCPVPDAGTLLYVNATFGFCFLYPADHTDNSSDLDFVAITRISGAPVSDGTIGLTTSFTVTLEDGLGRSSSEFVTEKIDQAKIPGSTPTTTSFTLDGEAAIWTEALPSQVGARSGYLVHNGLGYILTLIPNGGDFDDINIAAENLWTTITTTWQWFDGSGPTPTPIAADTEDSEGTEATLHTPSFCRRGPSVQYGTATGFEPGTVLQVDGRSAIEPRWLWVLIPDTTAHCWISESVVDVNRPTDGLPAIAPPPLPTVTDTPTMEPPPEPPPAPTAPTAPSGLAFTNQVCGGGLMISLSWNDNANNESGYRVYRDGVLVATLSANSTSYSEVAPNKASGTNYYVEAYNAQGASSSSMVTSVPCPIA